MVPQMVVLNGRLFEDAATLRVRLHIKELTMRRLVAANKLPRPVRIGISRYYEKQLVDEYLLRQVNAVE
jgi:hypothetical protein